MLGGLGVAQIWKAGKVMEMRKGGLREGGEGGFLKSFTSKSSWWSMRF